MSGLFDLKSAPDLLRKLHREFQRLVERPTDVDHAFNFFVTAEHLLDWLHPGRQGRAERSRLRSSHVLLEVTSHLANGAKHFGLLLQHHQSIEKTSRVGGHFHPDYFAKNWWAKGHFREASLVVTFSGDAEASLGSELTAVSLAELVLEYWSENMPEAD